MLGGRPIGIADDRHHLARAAFARGQTPFLHVFLDNPAAALYARLGFQERARLWVLWHRPVQAGEWVEQLEALKIGCGPINTLEQVFADPQVQARGTVVTLPHPATPDGVKVIANPVRLSETPADYRMAPPTLGQHTDEVLGTRLGLGASRLAELRDKGVI